VRVSEISILINDPQYLLVMWFLNLLLLEGISQCKLFMASLTVFHYFSNLDIFMQDTVIQLRMLVLMSLLSWKGQKEGHC